MESIAVKNGSINISSFNLSGNNRTKESFVKSEFLEVLESTNLKDLYANATRAAANLKSIGAFDYCDIDLATTPAKEGAYDVRINVNIKEKQIPFLKLETYLRRGALVSDIGCEALGALRNPFGYGEVISLSVGGSTALSRDVDIKINIPNATKYRNSAFIHARSAQENLYFFQSFHQKINAINASSSTRDNRHEVSLDHCLIIHDQI